MVVLDKKLYEKVVKEAKEKFKKWPSAYASGWVVSTYKKRGGRYSGEKNGTLERWYKEKWINVCELPKIVPCGRTKSDNSPYPYCRPLVRINKNTPKTVDEISKKELENRCNRKRRNPAQRII